MPCLSHPHTSARIHTPPKKTVAKTTKKNEKGLPGTTEAIKSPVEKCDYAYQLGNDSAKMAFTGTASDGTAGISGMQLVSHGLGALKSTALLPHAIVGTATVTKRPAGAIVGAEGTDAADAAVVTTIESRLVQTDVVVVHNNGSTQRVSYGDELLDGRYNDIAWVWHNGTGYLFPKSAAAAAAATTVAISVVAAAASDDNQRPGREALRGAAAAVTMPPLFTIGIEHPQAASLPSSASYIAVPGVGLDEMVAVAASSGNVVIAESSERVHAVQDLKREQLLAVFWNAQTGGTVTFPPFPGSNSTAIIVTSTCGVALTVSRLSTPPTVQSKMKEKKSPRHAYNITIADPTNGAGRNGEAVRVVIQEQQLGLGLGQPDGRRSKPDAACAKHVASIALPKSWSAGQSVSAESHCVS